VPGADHVHDAGIISPGIGQRSAQAVGSGAEPAASRGADGLPGDVDDRADPRAAAAAQLVRAGGHHALVGAVERAGAQPGPSAATVSVPLPGTFGASFARRRTTASPAARPGPAPAWAADLDLVGIPASISAVMIPL
jgi:hypothetical protein